MPTTVEVTDKVSDTEVTVVKTVGEVKDIKKLKIQIQLYRDQKQNLQAKIDELQLIIDAAKTLGVDPAEVVTVP